VPVLFADNFETGNATRWSGNSMESTVTLPGGVELAVMLVPRGTFQMGASPGEQGADPQEYPQHEVTLTHDFHIGAHEITQAQWQALMGSNPAHDYGVGDDYPVYYVSWDDIAGPEGFLERLNQHLTATGQPGAGLFRLPTEAEWELAARAGTQTRFSFGDNLDCDDACGVCALAAEHMWWCGIQQSTPSQDTSRTHPVASLDANGFGLYDMHGGVSEWVADWYDVYPADPQTDPIGPTSGTLKVQRSGAWFFVASSCRSASRGGFDPATAPKRVGFRVARSE